MRVAVDSLGKRYRGEELDIFGSLSLYIVEGEKVVILGLNGAGKTTLIKCILGLLTPDAGTIRINGSENIRRQREKIGVVSQYNSFDRRLTIQDNLLYHAGMYGVTKFDALSRMKDMAEDFGFLKHLEDRPSKLSGGTLRKAVLVRALITNPNVIIMDEPTANVDPQYRNVLQAYLDKVTSEGGSVLMSTHIRDDIVEAKNATIYLLDQKVLRTITSEEIDIFFNGTREAFHGSNGISSNKSYAL